MGALASAAETVAERHKPGPSCTVGTALAAMDDDDRATLLGWVAEGRQWSWIAQVLATAGLRIGAITLSRHFRGGCRCDG